jgi:chemotaxis protein histidine kinase CheA
VDQIKSQLDRLADLDDEQVTELEAGIVTEFESVEAGETTPESVDAMTALAEMLETVRAESQRRVAQAEELAARAAEAASRVKGDEIEEAAAAPMEEEEPVSTDEDEMPDEETPEEMMEEPEMEEETPIMEEEEDEDKDKTMSKASTGSEKAAEFTAEADENIVEEAAVEVVESEPEAEVAEEVAAVEEPAEVFAAEEAEIAPEAEEFSAEEAEETPEEATGEEVFSAEEVVAEESETETSEPEAQEEAPVTAAVDGTIDVPADRRPVAPVASAPVAITAGADIPGHSAGSTLADMREVAEAMEKRLHSLRRVNGGDGEQHIVASIATQYPEDRVLGTDPEENRSKIERVVGADALVASGGFATPLEVRYDVFGLGTAIRPVRDSLPRFQADRGGVRYVTPPVLADYADAVGVWTNETDEDPGEETKASLTVTAAQELTAYTDAVTLQMQFGNLFTRAYPELLARHNELGLIQHAREAEQNILSRISDDSTAVTTASLIGFARDFLVQIRRASAAYRSRHRIDPGTQLRAIIPSWVYDAMAADLSLAMPGDGTLSVSSSEINGYLANSNVSLVASLDATTFGAQSAGALNEFPDTFTWYLFAEGSFLFLDGGTLDLGIIRDSGLVGTNDYKMFVETFEGVAFVGTESLAITSTISVNGVAAALRDTTGGATASAIEY